ncbi:unnamed protein product [Adineta steineri]|uniref:Uncharacterized protein n=1 Tax=Adineta steineri TaxID=433720 RepID=A0A814WYZ5_9BILA|nr:unnamed protein product [Adineta steineri]CAF1208006.1 unnamed protein product [Adineta steineri]CAF1219147.1 unnamed protein product [Adineta steineri]
MFSFSLLYFLFLNIIFFNKLQWIDAGRNDKYSEDLTKNPDFGNLPPRPGEHGSQVPSDWDWKPVLVDDINSNDRLTRDHANRLYQKNILYSILSHQENEARKEYEAKEQEHIRNKQIEYNNNMKKQWKQDRMDSIPSKCIISRR